MIGLLKDASELQKYVRVSGTLKAASFLPFVADAQKKYLSPYLGDTLLEALDAWYNSANPAVNAPYTALLPYVQNAVSKFTIAVGAPSFDTILTESGFAVVMNQNLAPASKDRVQNFINSMLDLGWNEIETMLRFLETNKANYTSWTTSSAYTVYTGSFIKTAIEFDEIIRIDQSRLKFMQMKPSMDNVEILRIEPVISKAMADDIKAKVIAGTTTAAYTAILTNIKRAIAYFTMFEETKEKKYEEKGDAYLAEVKLTIDTTPANYALYAASDCYDSTKTSYNNFENLEVNKTFSMGGHF
jgi:hypothetical protein